MHFLKQIGTEKIGENAVPNVPEIRSLTELLDLVE